MKYYISVLKKYAVFTGRARRMEYWMFALLNCVFAIVALGLDHVFGLSFKFQGNILGYGYIYLLYGLAVMIPGFAVLARRLHDIGKSGWYFLVCFIPLAGAIWILVLLFKDSARGANKYGVNPKGDNFIDIDPISSNVS